jgi:hypothetical protein
MKNLLCLMKKINAIRYSWSRTDKNVHIRLVKRLIRQKLGVAFLIASFFFCVSWLADYAITNILAQGDFLMEGNWIAREWWQIMGTFRYIELPLWAIVVVVCAALLYRISKLVALLWLNFLSMQHVLGFITWLPYGKIDLIYRFPISTTYSISLAALLFAIPLTFFIYKYLC